MEEAGGDRTIRGERLDPWSKPANLLLQQTCSSSSSSAAWSSKQSDSSSASSLRGRRGRWKWVAKLSDSGKHLEGKGHPVDFIGKDFRVVVVVIVMTRLASRRKGVSMSQKVSMFSGRINIKFASRLVGAI